MIDECPKHFWCLPESCGDCPNDKNYIESNPDVLGGRPVIKGTRIDVDTVKTRLAGGETMDDLMSERAWSDGPWDWEQNYMGEPGDYCLHNESHDIAVIPSKGMAGDCDAALIALAPEMAEAILAWHKEVTSGSRLNDIDGPVERWAEVVGDLKKIAERLEEIGGQDE